MVNTVMRHFVFVLLIPLFCCTKDKARANDKIEMYLLKSYHMVSGICQVDASTVILKDAPLVSNDEIISYSDKEHSYNLDATAIQKINTLPGRTPFALTIDKEIVFLAVYMPLIMSSTCDQSITMYANVSQNKIFMNLGYPFASSTINDERNKPVLVATLQAQGKFR